MGAWERRRRSEYLGGKRGWKLYSGCISANVELILDAEQLIYWRIRRKIFMMIESESCVQQTRISLPG